MTIPEPPRPDEPPNPDVPHPGPIDPTAPQPAPAPEPPIPPLEPYDPSDPTAPRPGTRAGRVPTQRADSPCDFGNLEALRQLRELFPASRILFDLDGPNDGNVVTLESPPPLIIRAPAGVSERAGHRSAASSR